MVSIKVYYMEGWVYTTEMMRFKDKVVLINGGSRGIGRGIAQRFSSEGATVVVSANEERVQQVAEELTQAGGKSRAILCDVTDRQSVTDMYETVINEFGRLDVSIQNAGIITIARIEDMTEDEWDKTMAVNTKGVFLCCQAAAKIMLRQKSGCLINTGSGQSRDGFIYTPHYAASKMGVIGITQSLAKELAVHGIRVNAFCPGIIDTDMWAYNNEEWGKLLKDDHRKGGLMDYWVETKVPMKRVGTAEDVAGLVTFLASDDAAYITGQAINVDGGLIMS